MGIGDIGDNWFKKSAGFFKSELIPLLENVYSNLLSDFCSSLLRITFSIDSILKMESPI